GQEFANDDKKADMELMEKGEIVKFTVVFHVPGKITDMQFATMHIVWKETFIESTPKAMKTQTVNFELDPGLTDAKNK
ncbi:MAG: hypothetical protein KJ607_15010, partial [Bacteroidetes bacterium]|nr:hypothetical protein [Bacteroidota bacterium]